MKLVAIYNAWSDCLDLLEKSINNILPVVDGVIVVWSNQSNNLQENIPFLFNLPDPKIKYVHCEPLNRPAMFNETHKRNVGLEQAKKMGFTHFLMMDSDEFYLREDVMEARDKMEDGNLNGLVCGLRVYIKKPTLWCEDHTLVPFIQKLTPSVSVGDHRWYPFAYDKDRNAHIDPTRRPSHRDRVEWSEVVMHHYSWVRKDFRLKIDNSTASANIKKSTIWEDLQHAAPGYYCKFYRQILKESADLFNIEGPAST